MVSDKKVRRSEIASRVIVATLLFFCVAILIPVIVIAVTGLFTQTIPPGGDNAIYRAGPGYPAFNPQSWLLYLPAATMLFLSIWTLPLPMRGEARFGRHFAAALTFIMGAWSVPLGIAFKGAPGIQNEGMFAFIIYFLAWLIFVVRIVLGWLKWVPASWREKIPAEQRWAPRG